MKLHPDCEDECQVAAARGSVYSCHYAGRACAQLEVEQDDALRKAERMIANGELEQPEEG